MGKRSNCLAAIVSKSMQLEGTRLMANRKKVILDCDPGHDDAIAISGIPSFFDGLTNA